MESGNEDGGDRDIFENAVVTDLEGRDLSSASMVKAALRHLKTGGGFVEMPHGSNPANEYPRSDSVSFDVSYTFPVRMRSLRRLGTASKTVNESSSKASSRVP